MSKLQVVGFEAVEDVSKKTGQAYAIGQLHTMVELAPAFKDTAVAKGFMGSTYRCEVSLIQKIKHLQPPFLAEVVIEPVMRFGKREEQVVDVVPVERSKAAA